MLREARHAVAACANPGVLPELVASVERKLQAWHLAVARRRRTTRISVSGKLAVLRLLATDLTQREIGTKDFYVSFNTVKTHVKSIFRKLDVATRPDAVTRARELRLL